MLRGILFKVILFFPDIRAIAFYLLAKKLNLELVKTRKFCTFSFFLKLMRLMCLVRARC